jgi:predicted metalloprotease
MRLDDLPTSENVEDRRSEGGSGYGPGLGARGGLGIGTIVVLGLVGWAWAFHAEEKWRFMEPGDVESALKTASAIGDDRLQRQATGYVVPDAFTHGSAEQRTRWFTTGLKSGPLASCDTFSAAQL